MSDLVEDEAVEATKEEATAEEAELSEEQEEEEDEDEYATDTEEDNDDDKGNVNVECVEERDKEVKEKKPAEIAVWKDYYAQLENLCNYLLYELNENEEVRRL